MRITEIEINENNVKSAPDILNADGERSTRDIKDIFDRLPELIAAKHNSLVKYVTDALCTKDEMKKMIMDQIAAIGAENIVQQIYDSDDDGMVDNAEKVGGFWFSKTDADGNPTEEVYIHWYEDENGNTVSAIPIT